MKMTVTAAAVATALALTAGAHAAQITVDTVSSMGNAGMAKMGMMFLATTEPELAAIKNAGATTKVRVIPVGGMDPDGAAFTKAATDMKADLEKLRAALNANATLKAELAAKMVDVNKVLVAEVTADGTLVLYTQA